MSEDGTKTGEPAGLVALQRQLTDQYGVLLDHAQLRQVLGYRTASAFEAAIKQERIGVRIFAVPGRRGKFAFSADVARWLWMASMSDKSKPGGAP